MKICYFGDTAAQHLLRWSRYFAVQREGNEVHIITFNPVVLDGYHPVKVHVIRKPFSQKIFLARAASLLPMILSIRKKVKEIGPNIIHAHSAGGYAWMASLSGFRPLIITPWGDDVLINIWKSKLERRLISYALRKADLVTCDGENTRKAVIDMGISNKKIKYITFGVDLNKFVNPPNKKGLRQKLKLPERNIVISTRTLHPNHDVKSLIEAIPIVLNSVPDVFFVIAGGGSEKLRLEEFAKDLGILNSIRFVGQLNEDQLIQYMQAADIYVSTSLSESGLAASTAEAMACELPVINTDTGDIHLWIKDGEMGFIIPPKNTKIIASRIILLLLDPKRRLEMGRSARFIIEVKNNYLLEMSKVGHIYDQFLKKGYGA